MSGGLRLMFYDAGDIYRNLKQLRLQSKELDSVIDAVDELLPGDFEQIDLELPLGMTTNWIIGGRLYKLLGRHDFHKGFHTWTAALDWLINVEKDKPIQSIQYWGHGSAFGSSAERTVSSVRTFYEIRPDGSFRGVSEG